nr:hypothetical protein [Tanacetum cinerariifolium]
MPCSIPNTVGTSDWLSRLRASRGFPDTDNIGLETFLCSIRKDDSETCTESVLLKTPQLDKHEDGEDMQGRDDNADGVSLLAPLTWSRKRKRTVKKANQDFKVVDPVEEEENGHLDLLGCSQTEFTAIDTSLPSWKFEKMLYRRGNVWKVGDKKGKGSKRRDIKKSKKSYKKQQCVRTCAASKNSDTVSSPLPLTLTWNRKRKRTAKKVNQELKVADCVAEEEKGYLDIRAIDGSPPSWKYGKMSYRNNNVWRDGDKGLMSRDRKKGKESLNENGGVQKKKLKRHASAAKLRDAKEGCEKQKNLNICNSLKYVDKGKAMVRSKCAQGHDQGKTMVAASEMKQDNCSQLQEKRVLKNQIDGGSSVILIKSIPITNKKDMSGISKSCVKLQK